MDDVVRMAVGLGKNQRFGDFASVGEQDGVQAFLKCANNRPYLAGIYNIPVKSGRKIADIFIHLFPALFTGQAIAVFDLLLYDISAALSHLRLDKKNILSDIYAVDDGLLPGILTDHIFVKKSKGTLVRRSSQTDYKGSKYSSTWLQTL